MTLHCTPGEWRFGMRDDGSIWISLGDPVKGPHYQFDFPARLADARLACAAPDLYEALEGVLRVADRDTAEFNKARAALAKARGESA